MAFCNSGAGSTSPAKLIPAKGTGHVVTAAILLNPCLAHGAEGNVGSVLLYPAFELPFHSLVASHIVSMPRVSALEAHFSEASLALKFLRVTV